MRKTSALQPLTMKLCLHSVSGKSGKTHRLLCLDLPLTCKAEHGAGQRMLALFFEGSRHGKELLFPDSFCRKQIGHGGLAACDGAGLIQCHDLDAAGLFE